MKRVITLVMLLALLSAKTFAQTVNELVFKNPVLVAGTDKRTGATYRFSNVSTGTDALLTIASASQDAQLINNIDVTSSGWDKAFQPEIGKSGNVSANQEWWVRFNLKFVAAGTSNKKKLDKFYATAIDLDGDGYVVREWIQMYKPDSIKYRTLTYLTEVGCVNTGLNQDSKTKNTLGPVLNYGNIDTLGTPVMVTYTFMNTDEINFAYGARVGGGISNAGMRLNSLWFRSFNLQANSTLPVSNTAYTLAYDKKNVTLNWTSPVEDALSSFTIEKSTDGSKFEEAGRVTASAQTTAYTFTDANVSSATGVLYYRIVYKEMTGEIKYSGIKLARLSKETAAALSVYPNPVQGTANLTLPQSWQTKAVQVSIYNGAGVQVQGLSIQAASQTESLNLSQLARGMYVVKAQCEGVTAEQRIIKN